MTPTALLFAAAAQAAPGSLDDPTPRLGDPHWRDHWPAAVLSIGFANVRLQDGDAESAFESRLELALPAGWALAGTHGSFSGGSRATGSLRRRFGPHGALHAGIGGGWQERSELVSVPSEHSEWEAWDTVDEETPIVLIEAGARAVVGSWQVGLIATGEQPLGVANAFQVSAGAHVGRRFGGRTPGEREARRAARAHRWDLLLR
jgi:hypothetical protein